MASIRTRSQRYSNLSLDVEPQNNNAVATVPAPLSQGDFDLADLDSPSFWRGSLWPESNTGPPAPAGAPVVPTPRSPSAARAAGHFAAPPASAAAAPASSMPPPAARTRRRASAGVAAAAAAAAPPPPGGQRFNTFAAPPPAPPAAAAAAAAAAVAAVDTEDNDADDENTAMAEHAMSDSSDDAARSGGSGSRSRSPTLKRPASPGGTRGRRGGPLKARRGRGGGRTRDTDDRKLKKNQREKERRLQVNQRFDELASLVQLERASKADKVTVLAQAIHLIKSLREEVQHYRDQSAMKRSPVMTNRRVRGAAAAAPSAGDAVDDDDEEDEDTHFVIPARTGPGGSRPGFVNHRGGIGVAPQASVAAAVAATAQQHLTQPLSSAAPGGAVPQQVPQPAGAVIPTPTTAAAAAAAAALGAFTNDPAISPGGSDAPRFSLSGMYSTGLPIPGTPSGLSAFFGDGLGSSLEMQN